MCTFLAQKLLIRENLKIIDIKNNLIKFIYMVYKNFGGYAYETTKMCFFSNTNTNIYIYYILISYFSFRPRQNNRPVCQLPHHAQQPGWGRHGHLWRYRQTLGKLIRHNLLCFAVHALAAMVRVAQITLLTIFPKSITPEELILQVEILPIFLATRGAEHRKPRGIM